MDILHESVLGTEARRLEESHWYELEEYTFGNYHINKRRAFLDVVGFYFLDLAVNYQPPPELLTFLEAGETPIYIG